VTDDRFRPGGSVALEVLSLPAQVDLRMDPAEARRLSWPIPLDPNTWASAGELEILWLGPDEWLVVANADSQVASAIVHDLEAALEGIHRSVVDVSAGRTVLGLRGPRRHELLAGGCPIDLHPRAWSAGACAQTLLARAQVLLQERDEETRLFVRPSFADYVVDWLDDAAAGLQTNAG
jgi:sarcosine oxidase, subunit gamma